jgi:integrase
MLTGKRKSALANMRWEEIDKAWFWDAPESEAKNKRTHGIPLPVRAQRVLNERQARGKVFDGIKLDPLQTKVRKLTGIDDFIFHGVRHVIETKLAELKIAPHIRDLLLDHVPVRGSGAGYDHHHYRDEMSEAIEVWSKHIDKLVRAPLRVVQ